jgi:hypothetical protein
MRFLERAAQPWSSRFCKGRPEVTGSMVNGNGRLAGVVVGTSATIPVQEWSNEGFLSSNTIGSIGFDELAIEAE